MLTPRKLCLWNSNKQTSISDLAVQMNRTRCGPAGGAVPRVPPRRHQFTHFLGGRA